MIFIGKDGELLTSVIGGFKSIFGIGNEGWIFNQPYGVVLVLGSKKSDLSSLLKPLFASIAAGNYTVIKPTERLVRSETDKLVIEILKKTLDPKRSFVVDRETDYDALTPLTAWPGGAPKCTTHPRHFSTTDMFYHDK